MMALKAKFKVGDRVEAGAAGSDEHDTGTVVSFTFSQMLMLAWKRGGHREYLRVRSAQRVR